MADVYCSWCKELIHSHGLIEHSSGVCKDCKGDSLGKKAMDELAEFMRTLKDKKNRY